MTTLRPLLSRNVVIYDGDTLRGTPFTGEWVAVPSSDYQVAVKAISTAMTALENAVEYLIGTRGNDVLIHEIEAALAGMKGDTP